MADDLAPSSVAAPGGGFAAAISRHKGIAIGGAIVVVGGLGYLIYRHEKSSISTASSSAASAASTPAQSATASGNSGSGYVAASPYLAGAIGSGVATGTEAAYASSSAGAFAAQLASDFASAVAKNGDSGAAAGSSPGPASSQPAPVTPPGSATVKPSSSPKVAAGGNAATQAAKAGLSVIDKAEALRLVNAGGAWYVWNGTTFTGSRSKTIPAGKTIFGNTKTLTADKIPHAGT